MKTTATVKRQRDIARSIALLHLLRQRVGETSIHGFADKYDALASPANLTQDQGGNGWSAIFKGQRPLSDRRLRSLSAVPAWSDAEELYQDGPAALWQAMWGDTAALIACIRSHPKCTPRMALHAAEKTVEAVFLYGGPEDLSDLARAVALYRLRSETGPQARIDGYGMNLTGCAWRCVKMCLDEDSILRSLDALGVRLAVVEELTKLEQRRVTANPRAAVFD